MNAVRTAASDRKLAHLALDPARVAAAATGHHPLLQNLTQHALMKLFPLLRGE